MPKNLAERRRTVAEGITGRILSLQRAGESDKDFGERIGLGSKTISAYRNLLSVAGRDVIVRVVSRTGVDANWLLLGTDPPEAKTPAVGPDAVSPILRRLKRDLKDLEQALGGDS